MKYLLPDHRIKKSILHLFRKFPYSVRLYYIENFPIMLCLKILEDFKLDMVSDDGNRALYMYWEDIVFGQMQVTQGNAE